ncbi:COX15/CtaA family protein [Raineyella fluvialis]|uniref:Heme A synthase n=1 Tax=Raineyella fluvialis TaxID=2662261 RepID=A0A5Q2FDU1_9ACTN|nr:COX15/CtaA family protein [Raineyella fluvialis]QGF24969.1 heme A synthase [Raineyella fluvialis]
MTRLFGTTRALRGWSLANLIANSGIILTGGVVRVTGSGLGCSQWPKCTTDSYVTLPANGLHGMIEFGNRLLTFVLIVIAVGNIIAAFRARDRGATVPRVRELSILVMVGIVLQAVVGGITVWVKLSPYLVAVHLLLSAALVSICTWLVHLAWHRAQNVANRTLVNLTRAAFVLTWVAVYLGTLVTGSGPHAGDLSSPRTGFELETIAKIHAMSVWLLVALSIYFVVKLRSRQSYELLGVLLLQGAVGYIQYFAGLPRGLIILHLLGVCLVIIAATALVLSVRRPTVVHEHDRESRTIPA